MQNRSLFAALPLRLTLFLGLAGMVRGEVVERAISFRNDIMPQLLKAGCAGGNCHAKPEGQNNFKLSVFGYDPEHDYREIVMDGRGRRVFLAAPEESLLLKKATGAVPHEGGARVTPGSEAHQLLLSWIRQGVPFEVPGEAKLESVELSPREGSYAKSAKQALKVVAKFSDGSTKDVTALTEFLSQDKEMAEVDEHGLVNVGTQSGEGVVVARYMGLVDIARITVPSETKLPDAAYAKLPEHNEIDKLVHERHRKLGLLPSGTCTDEEFLRRASLDLIGMLPPVAMSRTFLADKRPDKRERLVNDLLQHPNYADHWAVKWGDLIRPNPSRVGVKPVYLLDTGCAMPSAKTSPMTNGARAADGPGQHARARAGGSVPRQTRASGHGRLCQPDLPRCAAGLRQVPPSPQ
jgi:hypothetical protein